MRTHGVPEQFVIIAAFQPVLTGLLFIGPACRQIGKALEVVVNDRTIADNRPDHFVATAYERLNQLSDFFPAYKRWRSYSHSTCSPILSSVVHERRDASKAGCARRRISPRF